MKIALKIAQAEWRLMRRDRVAILGIILFLILAITATLSASEHVLSVNAERSKHQTEANHDFESQPDRHPHRMVHFGHFLFRPLEPLSAFDPGVEAYTGHTLFLEGHRQNSANFGDVRQSSLLLRFGRLSPAFVLQVLAPLLLIFIAYGVFARERERGTLRLLLAQGTEGYQLMSGKLIAVTGIALILLAPALCVLAWLGVSQGTAWTELSLLASAYLIWLIIWSMVIVLISSLFARSREALLSLLAIWTLSVLLVPRIAPDIASVRFELPSKLETDIAVERDVKALGDPHNPNDPHFAAFRQGLLDKYGVKRIEDLPVNYKGLLAVEGEKNSSAMFQRYADQTANIQDQQSRLVDAFGLISPVIALQRLSMTVSGSDLKSFRDFLAQAENYRYQVIQTLNQLEADQISYVDDTTAGKENRISRAHWAQIPDFQYQAQASEQVIQQALPALMVLIGWLAGLLLLLFAATQRIRRVMV